MIRAEKCFAGLGLHSISTRLGDGCKGWPELAPFQRILVTAAAETPPPVLLEQLAVGGFMLIPVGEKAGSQNIQRITRTESGYDTEELLPVRFVPLVRGIAVEIQPSR